MLTVRTLTNVLSHSLSVYGQGEPSNILNGKTGSYFYIKRPGPTGSIRGSIFFNLVSSALDLIPSNAIINNFSITFNTETTNPIGTFDNIYLKLNGTTLANIDATVHTPNIIQSTTFQSNKLYGEDIFKSALEKCIFEIELSTEGAKEFRLHSINFSITYTEMIATNICKLMTKEGLVTIPLYNPISLPRYAMRIVTKQGPKSFDLVDLDDPAASPIRVMTQNGIKSIRMSLTPPVINIFNPSAEKLEGFYFDEKTGGLIANSGMLKDIACGEHTPIDGGGIYDIYCSSTPLSIKITVVEYLDEQTVLHVYTGINSIRIPTDARATSIRLCITAEADNFEIDVLRSAYSSIVVTKV